MISLGIVGYGNLGRGVMAAIDRNPDTRLTAIFTRRPHQIREEVKDIPVLDSENLSAAESIHIDVAVLCGGSSRVLKNRA